MKQKWAKSNFELVSTVGPYLRKAALENGSRFSPKRVSSHFHSFAAWDFLGFQLKRNLWYSGFYLKDNWHRRLCNMALFIFAFFAWPPNFPFFASILALAFNLEHHVASLWMSGIAKNKECSSDNLTKDQQKPSWQGLFPVWFRSMIFCCVFLYLHDRHYFT